MFDSVMVNGEVIEVIPTHDPKKNRVGFSAVVRGKKLTLRASYSVELRDELMALHGIDAAVELENILRTEIDYEIKRYLESL